MENFDWLEHNVSNDEKPAYVRRFMAAFVEHLGAFLGWLVDSHNYDARALIHVVEHPWKYIGEFKAFADANATPTTPQDLDPEKQARQDQLDCKLPERYETSDLTEDDIPF